MTATSSHRRDDGSAYRLSFRIRRTYFDQIVAGTKRSEIRRDSPFWHRRADKAFNILLHGGGVVAVFVCGPLVHRRALAGIREWPTAKEALGRAPSEQGLADIGDGPVLEFLLGAIVYP